MHSADMTPPVASCTNSNYPGDGHVEMSSAHPRSARSLSCSHATPGHLSFMRRSSASSSASVSFEDSERLPASIKRKLFFSTERLHIAPHSAVKHRRRKLSLGQLSTSVAMYDDQVRPATSGGLARRRSRRKFKEPNPAFTDLSTDSVTEEQAHWYLGLPDKIRKQQFTRREQITFALQCKRALESTAPHFAQDALRRCLNVGRDEELTRASTQRKRRSSAATVATDILLDEEFSQSSSTDLRSDSLLGDVNLADGYTSPVLRTSKSMVDVSLPPSSSPPPVARRASKSISLRRKSHNHLTPLPLPPPQLAPAPPLPLFPASFGNLQSVGSPHSVQAPATEPNLASPGPRPDSKLHQADVRKQLRQWLSPEKFDEALEYGFSFSTPETESLPATRNQSTSHQPPPLCHTDDDCSEEDGSDPLENVGPKTPTTVPEHLFPAAKSPSFDSSADLSLRSNPLSLWKGPRKHGPVESPAEREMTVRVTLTRRDLRDPGDPKNTVGRVQPFGVVDVERVDPLALEAITVCDDPTGAHGAFAVSTASGPKGLKKVWKALRGH